MHVSKMRIKVYHVEIKWTYGLVMYMAIDPPGEQSFPIQDKQFPLCAEFHDRYKKLPNAKKQI